MSQQCGMEPSHSPLQGPMLVSHCKLPNISLAESLCPSYSILADARNSEIPPRITVGVRRYRKRVATVSVLVVNLNRAQITEARPIRSAGNPPPPESHRKGRIGKNKNWRDEKRQRPKQRQKNRTPRVARKRRKQRKKNVSPDEGRLEVSKESKPLMALETPQNKTKKIDLTA